MTRFALSMLLLLSLAACKKNDSDDVAPNASAMASPATVAPPVDATMPPPVTDTTMPPPVTDPTTMGTDAGPGATATNGSSATASGQSDATLTSDLGRCDTLPVAEQTTCRSDAQARYSERAASGAKAPPTRTP